MKRCEECEFVQVNLGQTAMKLVKRHRSLTWRFETVLLRDVLQRYSEKTAVLKACIRSMAGNWDSFDTLLEPFQAKKMIDYYMGMATVAIADNARTCNIYFCYLSIAAIAFQQYCLLINRS